MAALYIGACTLAHTYLHTPLQKISENEKRNFFQIFSRQLKRATWRRMPVNIFNAWGYFQR